MAAYFLDSSALVKRYAIETGSAWVTNLLNPATGNRIYIARITDVETVAAITRKKRGNHLTATEAVTAIASLDADLLNILRIVEITPQTLASARVLAERHTLRGYDAVQLASAIEADTERRSMKLAPLVFITADKDLLVAAPAEGIAVDNSENH